MNTLEIFEKNQIKELHKDKKHPTFYPGDTLKIHLKIKEGEKERIQIFEGICIAKKNAGINTSFTVRKVSYGEGVERVFPYYSPQIAKIDLFKRGSVRRSKLYYLRERSGKSARITEKNKFLNKNNKDEDFNNKKIEVQNKKITTDSIEKNKNKSSDLTKAKNESKTKEID